MEKLLSISINSVQGTVSNDYILSACFTGSDYKPTNIVVTNSANQAVFIRYSMLYKIK